MVPLDDGIAVANSGGRSKVVRIGESVDDERDSPPKRIRKRIDNDLNGLASAKGFRRHGGVPLEARQIARTIIPDEGARDRKDIGGKCPPEWDTNSKRIKVRGQTTCKSTKKSQGRHQALGRF